MHFTGLDFRRFPTPEMRNLLHFLRKHSVNTCLDVGANTGQFGEYFRACGFKGKIISFEPQSKVFNILERKSRKKKNWTAFNFALGEKNEKAKMHLSKNSFSSSLMNFAPGNLSVNAEPDTSFVGSEEIIVKRLDDFLKEEQITGDFFLKIDAQGYEEKVLEGLGDYWKKVAALELELSCVPVYEEGKLLIEMIEFIISKGFYLSSLQNGFTDPATGMLLQAEGIFLKKY